MTEQAPAPPVAAVRPHLGPLSRRTGCESTPISLAARRSAQGSGGTRPPRRRKCLSRALHGRGQAVRDRAVRGDRGAALGRTSPACPTAKGDIGTARVSSPASSTSFSCAAAISPGRRPGGGIDVIPWPPLTSTSSRIGALEVSPDGSWVAFCEDSVGRSEFTLRFKNLATGVVQDTVIRGLEAGVAWTNDNRGILYVEKDPETLLGLRVKKHVLGQDTGLDTPVFAQTDKSFYTSVSKSKSDRFIFLLHGEHRRLGVALAADADDPTLESQNHRCARARS